MTNFCTVYHLGIFHLLSVSLFESRGISSNIYTRWSHFANRIRPNHPFSSRSTLWRHMRDLAVLSLDDYSKSHRTLITIFWGIVEMENIFTKLMFFSIEEKLFLFWRKGGFLCFAIFKLCSVFLSALMSKNCNVIFKPESVAAALTPNMHNRKEMLCQQ